MYSFSGWYSVLSKTKSCHDYCTAVCPEQEQKRVCFREDKDFNSDMVSKMSA